MSNAALETAIEAAWEARDTITPATKGEARDAIEATLSALDPDLGYWLTPQAQGYGFAGEAAREVIAASRALLDAAEDLVEQPSTAELSEQAAQALDARWLRLRLLLESAQDGGQQRRRVVNRKLVTSKN